MGIDPASREATVWMYARMLTDMRGAAVIHRADHRPVEACDSEELCILEYAEAVVARIEQRSVVLAQRWAAENPRESGELTRKARVIVEAEVCRELLGDIATSKPLPSCTRCPLCHRPSVGRR